MSATLQKPSKKRLTKVAEPTFGEKLIDSVKRSMEEMRTGEIAVSRARNSNLGACCGLAIKSAREEEGLSTAELAERSGVRAETISRLENGLVKNPTVETLDRLTAAMGRTLNVVVGTSPKRNPPGRKA